MIDLITISDVAREAGVAIMTVSRMVNDNDKSEIGPTRRRVIAVVEPLGYRPSGIPRGLATQLAGTFGFVIPDILSPFFFPMLPVRSKTKPVPKATTSFCAISKKTPGEKKLYSNRWKKSAWMASC
jgi:hypothetical protein